MKSIAEINDWYNEETKKIEEEYEQHVQKIDNWKEKITAAFENPKITGDEILAMAKEACADM